MAEIRQRKPLPGTAAKFKSPSKSRNAGAKGVGSSLCRAVFWLILLVILTILAIIVLTPAPIDPFIITELHPPPHFNGTLEPNTELLKAERLFENEINGPESIVVRDGSIYMGTADGQIIQIDQRSGIMKELARLGKPPCGRRSNDHTCGRPTGLRFDVTGDLFVTDAYLGVHRVNPKTGEVKNIISPDTLITGKVPVFFNDLALDGQDVFLSDSSRSWSMRDIPLMLMEGNTGGRLIRYNRKTGKAEEIIDDMRFSNGVEISHDRTYVIVAETGTCRILRYDLTGWKKGSYTVFANDLPGFPDNVRRSSTGGYWVAFTHVRRADWFSFFDYTAEKPWIRKWLTKIVDPRTLMNLSPRYGLIAEYDDDGHVIRSLHDPTGEVISSVSEVYDDHGILYLGSSDKPYIAKIDLREANRELMKQRQAATAS